jgi:predicted alpha/beta hydrolase family esterase
MQTALVIVPGLGNSGTDHWQTLWEKGHPHAARVQQRDWDHPDRNGWIAALDETVRHTGGPVALVTHSLACALVAHWALGHDTRPVRAAFLVSPSDVDSSEHTPPEARVFAPMPMERLPFPSFVVASEDDAYVTVPRARSFAAAWGAEMVSMGQAGHINSQSGLGTWPTGEALLRELIERAG